MSLANLKSDLRAIVGEQGLLEGSAVRERGQALFHGRVDSDILVRPRSTEQVSGVLKLCHARGQTVVTHGGLTGLVQGADAGSGDIVLSLESMNAIERVDVAGRSLRAQAGVQLGRVQREAEDHGMVFPLDLGARDSCTVGGNISTNAGGLRVLRYGMMRNLVLGIEAVLADGTVLTSLNRMLKNNAGYDLKQLFIGSEGTLGIVTRAELRLVSRTRSQETLLASLPSFDAMVELLGRLDSGLGGQLAAFEALWGNYYDYNTAPPAPNAAPLARGAPFYVIAESLGGDPEADRARLEAVLGEALEAGVVSDVVIAKTSGRCRTSGRCSLSTSVCPSRTCASTPRRCATGCALTPARTTPSCSGTWPTATCTSWSRAVMTPPRVRASRTSSTGRLQPSAVRCRRSMASGWRSVPIYRCRGRPPRSPPCACSSRRSIPGAS
jgi:FAD/FMN-containing dehydrogenase